MAIEERVLVERIRRGRIFRGRILIVIALSSLCACDSNEDGTGAADAGGEPGEEGAVELLVTRVAMRDGVELYTEVLLPEEVGDGVPTLLLRTPYDLPTTPPGAMAPDEDARRAAWRSALDRGYAVVLQNLRGTQSSGGRHALFATEREDGVDAIEWIRAQTWSDGRVGALGDSAASFPLHLLAAERPRGLRATFSQAGCGDMWASAVLPDDGSLKLEAFLPFMLQQALESSEAHRASLGLDGTTLEALDGEIAATLGALFGDDPAARLEALTAQPFIDYPAVSTLMPRWGEVLDEADRGDRQAYFDTRGQSAVPGMHVTLWQDIFVECAIGDFRALADAPAEQRLLVLDGSHYDIDDPDNWPYRPMLDWFDRHLRDEGGPLEDGGPRVRYAVQSAASLDAPSAALLDGDAWPPTEALERSYYLAADGALADAPPSTVSDAAFPVVSDPAAPSSTVGGRHLSIRSGVAEQPPLPKDGSVQAFATGPFEATRTIAGTVRLESRFAADVPDADLHARLVEVTADGRRVLVVAGHARARYREGPLLPVPLTPGVAVPLRVTLGDIAHRVAAGSRLQLELTGSDFPAFSINPQTGEPPFTDTLRRAGVLTISSDPDDPARLVVPFLP